MKFEVKKIKKLTKLKWIILFICIVGFLEISLGVFSNELMKRDIIGYEIVNKYLISDFVTPIVKIITQFGGLIVIFILATISTILIKNKRIGISIYLNLFIIGSLNQILKYIVQRPRPIGFRLIDESGYSFPSGHSMASAAFYGFYIYLVYKNVKSKKKKIIIITLLGLLILLVGISRIYLGVHYTTDVIAGFLVSISYLTIYTSLINDFIEDKRETLNKKNN